MKTEKMEEAEVYEEKSADEKKNEFRVCLRNRIGKKIFNSSGKVVITLLQCNNTFGSGKS